MAYFGKEVAAHYAQFRPSPPVKLINHTLEFLSKKKQSPFHKAVDVGSGSGQLTQLLSPHFKEIVGIDTSPSQVDEANKNNPVANIQYKQGSASEIPVRNNSADLVVTCQAVHWFNLKEFFQEVNRILNKTGVLAISGYSYPEPVLPQYSHQLSDLIKEFFKENEQLWHENNKLLLNRYHDLKLPFKSTSRIDPIAVDIKADLKFLLEHLLSRSGIQNLKKKDPQKASAIMEEFQRRFQKIIHSDLPPHEIPMTVRFNYFLILCYNSDFTSV